MSATFDKTPSFTEESFRGTIKHEERVYPFWLVRETGVSLNPTNPPNVDYKIQWFYKSIPKELRREENEIIEQFKIGA